MKETAKEFIEMNSENHSLIDIEGIMIEFAKLHVEAALKEASEKYWIDATTSSNSIQGYKDLILNSYPLENIK
jgi:hypothetical protein